MWQWGKHRRPWEKAGTAQQEGGTLEGRVVSRKLNPLEKWGPVNRRERKECLGSLQSLLGPPLAEYSQSHWARENGEWLVKVSSSWTGDSRETDLTVKHLAHTCSYKYQTQLGGLIRSLTRWESGQRCWWLHHTDDVCSFPLWAPPSIFTAAHPSGLFFPWLVKAQLPGSTDRRDNIETQPIIL